MLTLIKWSYLVKHYLLAGEPFLTNRLGLLEYSQAANIFLILPQFNSNHCPLGQTSFLKERWSLPSAAFRSACCDTLCLCSAFHALLVLEMLVTGKNTGASRMRQSTCSIGTQHREIILPVAFMPNIELLQSCLCFMGICPARPWSALHQADLRSYALLFQKPHLKGGGKIFRILSALNRKQHIWKCSRNELCII